MNEALLIGSLNALVACRDQAELSNALALVAQRLIGATDACVLVRGSISESGVTESVSSTTPTPSSGLASWAAELLERAPHARFDSSGRRLAAVLVPSEIELRGVLAVELAGEASEEQRALLGALADLGATCSAQLEHRAVADQRLRDLRALMARGLHDLCTPLNSLRLGLHLLEPALTTKDPAVAQRAHRAIDRLASLVTSLAEALGASKGPGISSHAAQQNGASPRLEFHADTPNPSSSSPTQN